MNQIDNEVFTMTVKKIQEALKQTTGSEDPKQWVNYKLIPEGDKVRKMPISPATNNSAKANDPSTWGTLEQALKNLPNCDGIGVEFSGSGLIGIDMDHIIDESDGAVKKEHRKRCMDILEQLNTYTEYSPSGTGLHLLIKADKTLCNEITEGKKKSSDNLLEIYHEGRFFTVTGSAFGQIRSVKSEPAKALDLYRRYWGRETTSEPVSAPMKAPEEDKFFKWSDFDGGSTDDEIIEKIRQSNDDLTKSLFFDGDISHYENDDSRADAGLILKLLYWTDCDLEKTDSLFRRSALFRPKWDRKNGQSTYGQITIKNALQIYNNYSKQGKPLPQVTPSKAPAEPPLIKYNRDYGKILTFASKVKHRDYKFIIDPFIPKGDTSLCFGAGGNGKSFVSVGFASTLSLQGKYTLIFSSEDDESTITDRIKATGGDPSYIAIIDRDKITEEDKRSVEETGKPFFYYDNLIDNGHLKGLWESANRPELIIFDPVQQFYGADINPNSNPDIRRIMTKIGAFAYRNDCGILFIGHENKAKATGNANDKSSGSADLINAVRSAFTVVYDGDPNKPDDRILVHTKINHTKRGQSQRFRIITSQVEDEDGQFIEVAGIKALGIDPVRKEDLEEKGTSTRPLYEIMRDRPNINKINAFCDFVAEEFKKNKSSLRQFNLTYKTMKEKSGDMFDTARPKQILYKCESELNRRGYHLLEKSTANGKRDRAGYKVTDSVTGEEGKGTTIIYKAPDTDQEDTDFDFDF